MNYICLPGIVMSLLLLLLLLLPLLLLLLSLPLKKTRIYVSASPFLSLSLCPRDDALCEQDVHFRRRRRRRRQQKRRAISQINFIRAG